jgi:DNA-binding NarL/FixJ family response regulator
MGNSPIIRVLLAHHFPPLVQVGLRAVLSRARDLLIVGEATQPAQIQEQVQVHQPDILVLDAQLPASDLAQLCAALRLSVRIVVLTSVPDEEQLVAYLMCGACAYQSASLTGEALLETIRRVSNGEYLFSSSILPRPTKKQAPLPVPRALRKARRVRSLLTPQEQLVLLHVLRGQGNKQIAQALEVSSMTVKCHLTSVMKKLQVRNRIAAVAVALTRGIISEDEADLALKETALPRRGANDAGENRTMSIEESRKRRQTKKGPRLLPGVVSPPVSDTTRDDAAIRTALESLKTSLALLKRFDLYLPPVCYRELELSLQALSQLIRNRGPQWHMRIEVIRNAVIACRQGNPLQRSWICDRLTVLIEQVMCLDQSVAEAMEAL